MDIVVFDDFNGANGTDIADHAPEIDVVGGGWSQSGNNLVELDGLGAVKFFSSADSAWINCGINDQVVKARITAGGADNRFQLVARSDNNRGNDGTNYSLNARPAVSGSNNLVLFRNNNGSLTTLASVEFPFSASSTYELEISAVGNVISAKVDGVEQFSVVDSGISSGIYAGFYHALYTNGALRLYDFTVEDATGGGAVTADAAYTISAPTFTSSASVTLPQPIADASFTVNAPTFSAEASATIPGFSASVSFAIPAPTFAADAAVTLPNPTADIGYTIAAPTFSVNADATLPQPSSDVVFTVNSPSFAVTATATEPGFNASVNFTINAPTFSANASATLPQPSADAGFTVSAPTFSVVAIVGGIAIIVDNETNINVPALATNIDAPVQSNNVRI